MIKEEYDKENKNNLKKYVGIVFIGLLLSILTFIFGMSTGNLFLIFNSTNVFIIFTITATIIYYSTDLKLFAIYFYHTKQKKPKRKGKGKVYK